MPSKSFRLTLCFTFIAATVPAIAQSSASAATPPSAKAFHGRGWGEYFRAAAEARSKATGAPSREMAMIHHASSDTRFHHDAGTAGTESYPAYFSGSDSSLAFNLTNSAPWAGVQRQSNCSLSEQVINFSGSKYQVEQTIASFEKYLHSVAGLTSTVDKFPNGCVDPTSYGQMYTTVPAGKTSSGNLVSVSASKYMNQVFTEVYTPDLVSVSTKSYPVSFNIAGVVAGDFNGDGYQDIAVLYGSYNSSQITILIANGDGTYKTPVNIASDSTTLGLVTGDFNGDKKVDIVATAQNTSGDYELLFFAGNGDGTFKPYTSVDTGTTERLVSLPVDINKDGKLDIVAWDFNPANYPASYTLTSLINNGAASFTPTESVTAALFHPVAAGDLNGDGKLDLVYTDYQANSATVLEGNGSGSFTFKATIPTVLAADSAYITDYDGDGNNDILVGVGSEYGSGPTQQGTGEILLGNGDFTFTSPAALAPPAAGVTFDSGPRSFAVADLNGDAKQDVAAYGHNSAAPSTVVVGTYLNDGTANLAANSAINFTIAPPSSQSYALVSNLVAVPLKGTSPNSLIVAGIAPGTSQGAIQSAVNNGSGTFTVNSALLDLPAPIASFASADFNADSKADLAIITNDYANDSADGLYIALGNGDGTFKAATLLDPAVTQGGSVFIADVNGDGKPDIVAIQSTSGYSYVRVYLNQGSSFAAPVAFSTSDGASISGIIPVDFNGDGKLDLILIGTLEDGGPSNLYFYTGNKTATFTYASTMQLGYVFAQTGIALDVNHDGITDLVLDGCCEDGTASVLLGKGAGAFQPPQPLLPVNASGVQAISLNTDAYPDLVFGTNNSVSGATGGAIVPFVNHYATAPAVAQSATVTTLTNPPTEPVTQGIYLQLRITVKESATPEIPTGSVSLLSGSKVITSGLLDDTGSVYLNLDTTPLAPGSSYPYTITYNGDAFNKPSSTTFSVTINYATTLSISITPNPVPYQASVTLKGTVARTAGSGYPTGYVSFFYNNGNTPIATNLKLVNGSVTLDASTKGLPAGIYQVIAYYFGDANDGSSDSPTVPVTLVPKGLDGSVTTLALSPNPITDGQVAKLTATVTKSSGSGVPTGNVTFAVQGEKLAIVPLNQAGVATVSASTVNYYPNSYPVTATYSGDSTTYKSISPVLNVILRYPTTTTLHATPNSVTAGQSVTLTAAVSYETFEAPTGTVKFAANGITLGTVPLNGSGLANLTATVNGIPAGTYHVTATYSGDTYDGASTSAPATVTVH